MELVIDIAQLIVLILIYMSLNRKVLARKRHKLSSRLKSLISR